jgi:hypothetical protein
VVRHVDTSDRGIAGASGKKHCCEEDVYLVHGDNTCDVKRARRLGQRACTEKLHSVAQVGRDEYHIPRLFSAAVTIQGDIPANWGNTRAAANRVTMRRGPRSPTSQTSHQSTLI